MSKEHDKPYMGMGVYSSQNTQHVPVGMEQVLVAAASDDGFRARLLADRETAVEDAGFQLSETEKAVLKFAPKDQLAAMIDGLDTTEKSLERRGFMKAVAATVVTIAAAGTLEACKEKSRPESQKTHPEATPPTQNEPAAQVSSGEDSLPTSIESHDPSRTDAGTFVEIPKPEKNIKGGARPDVEGSHKKKKKKLPVEGPPGLTRGITRD